MPIVFDSNLEIWSVVAQAVGYTTAFIYGAFRREYTQLWPILALGICLDAVAEIFLSSNGLSKPGMLWGALVYPVYSLFACVGGIMTRVAIEAVVKPSTPTSPTHLSFRSPPSGTAGKN